MRRGGSRQTRMDNSAKEFARKVISELEGIAHNIQSIYELKHQPHKQPSSTTDKKSTDNQEEVTPPAIRNESNSIGGTIKDRSAPKDRKEWHDRWKFRLEVGGALILTIYTGFAGWQACEIRKSNGYTIGALRLNRDTLVTSHRPWVFLDGGVENVKPLTFDSSDGRATVSYTIKNFGASPALRMIVSPTMIAQPITPTVSNPPCSDPDLIQYLNHTKAGGFLVPGGIKKVTDVEVSAKSPVRGARIGVVLEFCIAYRDEFNNLHMTGEYWIYKPAQGPAEYAPQVIPQFIPQAIVDGQWQSMHFNTTAY